MTVLLGVDMCVIWCQFLSYFFTDLAEILLTDSPTCLLHSVLKIINVALLVFEYV